MILLFLILAIMFLADTFKVVSMVGVFKIVLSLQLIIKNQVL